jgi:hypothetical protein
MFYTILNVSLLWEYEVSHKFPNKYLFTKTITENDNLNILGNYALNLK